MERSRSAALPLPAALDEFPDLSLPTATPLSEHLETLRSARVTRDDVTAFVEGLARPLGAGETPRHRADLLLDVLEDEHLSGLVTPAGSAVGPAALEALQRLGFPYALEVTPEMLVHAQRPGPGQAGRSATAWGVGLAVASILPILLTFPPLSVVAGIGALFVGPALASALCREVGARLPHRFFNAVQWFVGTMLLVLTASEAGMSPVLMLASGALSLPSLLSAWCLRRGPRKEFTP